MSFYPSKYFARFVLALGLMACVFTQFYALNKIPGLHFDEAWQGEFAFRFLYPDQAHVGPAPPLAAMNSYTTPIIHWILALQFKIFEPSLEVMRSTLALMNLTALFVCLGALAASGVAAQAVFAWIWALLPLSVHDHRFFIEMTSLHGLCFALFVALSTRTKPLSKTERGSLALCFLIGCYSHVLFLAVGISTLIFVASRRPERWMSRDFRITVSIYSILLLPLTIRMALGTRKAMPFILVALLIGLSLISYRASEKQWALWGRIASATARLIPFLAIPYLFFFSIYLIGGSWPYAQVTSQFSLMIGIPNAALWILILATATARPRSESEADAVAFFYCIFLTTSILILNQSPRYYMMATIAALFVMALRLSTLKRPVIATVLGLFIVWNASLFQFHYLVPFFKNGSRVKEFRSWRFHDSARDFRPIQRVNDWLRTNGCRYTGEIEPSMFQIYLPLAFLSHTEPDDRLTCKLDKKNLMIATLPENLTSPVAGYHLLHTERDWGDLAAWTRSP